MHQELASKEAFIERTVGQLKDIHISYITQLAICQVYERAKGLFGSAR